MEKIKPGDRYGMLTVIRRGNAYVYKGNHYARWICRCACGKETLVRGSALLSGNTKSCGCKRLMSNQQRRIKQDYTIRGSYTVCTLSNGISFLIDTEDYEQVKEYTWAYNRPRDYIFCTGLSQMQLSRFLMGCPPGLEVDHINHNRLDNRRCNLRIASHRQNCANTRPQLKNKSGYKGVSFCKQTGKWKAFCKTEDGKSTTLGRFDSKQEAAVLRDYISYKMHGEFAWLNFPECIEDYRAAADA